MIQQQIRTFRFSILARKDYSRKEGYKLFVRIFFENQITELKTPVWIKTTDELDKETKLPVDLQKKGELQCIIDNLRSYGMELQRNGLLRHPSQIIQAYKGLPVTGMRFLETFKDFITHQEAQVKSGNLSQGSMKNYYTTQRYLIRFIKESFKRSDIPMTQFDRRFLDSFLIWLTNNTTSTNNGRQKHFERLKRFTNLQLEYGHIHKTPFNGFKIQTIVKSRVFLDEQEISAIRNLKLNAFKLQLCRDLFLFMCNTGLAYSDLFNLNKNNLIITTDGKLLKGKRQKTNIEFIIPLTDEANNIILLYQNHPKAVKRGKLLPVYSNQLFNNYLHEISQMANLSKSVTTHVARHSFATTAITYGVPLTSIQKVLGHTDQRMTLHYARIIDKKVQDDMELFKTKMNEQIIKQKMNEATDKIANYKPVLLKIVS